MAGKGWIVTAAGGRAPDFVPAWVQALIAVLAFGLIAAAMWRRTRRDGANGTDRDQG
ncbi:hypothetical protein ACFYP4_21200 [Streptomyces sp. NPDC005551]|uniref:hypothetical protein n=1 Tax=Streptomyces sp. NPDC005551 TaxID=3364725 RepID=UPI0036761FD8